MKPAAVAPRVPGVAIKTAFRPRYAEVLTPAALRFLADLHREFEATRERVLAARAEPQQRNDAAPPPAGTSPVRGHDPQIEIIGPVDREAIAGSLTSAADGVVVDFERAAAPAWTSCMEGQINIRDRWRRKREVADTARNHPALVDRPAAGPASICRSSKRLRRRACGARFSPSRRNALACRLTPSARPRGSRLISSARPADRRAIASAWRSP